MTVTLVLGGVRSGKSDLAERLLRDRPHVRYIAPGPVPDGDDDEWARRVAAHRQRRPATWTTHESADVARILRTGDEPVLLDCLGTWMTRLVDDADVWDDPVQADALLARARQDLVDVLRVTRADVVVVSNEVGLGVVPATASGRFFRDELGRLNRAVADVCDEVFLVVAGRVLDLSAQPRVEDHVRSRR